MIPRGGRPLAPAPGQLRCVKRERIDLEENPRRSLLHKLWSDGTEEHYELRFEHGELGSFRTVRAEIDEADWLRACARFIPRLVPENSDWEGPVPR